MEENGFSVELLDVLMAHPLLSTLDRQAVEAHLELLHRHAPRVAVEVLISAPLINGMIRVGGVDIRVMREICELEACLRDL